MKKSELKKRLVEALTPDEAAKVEPKYKETYAAMIKGKGPLKLKKYDNPDKVVRGRVINTIKNESLKIAEKLGKTADVGDYKDDFRKSDAPQFKGKSKKKRDQMATAAFLNKEDLDVGHQDDEPRMIKKDIYNMGKYAMEIFKKLDQYDDMEGEVDFPHWWQSKITKAKSMLQSAYDYLDGEERISQIDAIMEKEDKLPVDKIEDKVKAILKKEGGAVGLKPLVDATKELGASKKDLLDILKKMKSVKTHKDGDIIDTAGLNENAKQAEKWTKMDPKEKKKLYPKFHNRKYSQLRSHEKSQIKEGHGLDQGDLDYLKDFMSRNSDNTKLNKILNFLIKSNIKVDKTKDLSKGKKVDEASGMDIAKKNMDMYKDKNRLEELVKAALMGPISEKMDPVGKEDDDINNDGKVDKTDKYLKNKRDAISKNIKEDNLKEDTRKAIEIIKDKWFPIFDKNGIKLKKHEIGFSRGEDTLLLYPETDKDFDSISRSIERTYKGMDAYNFERQKPFEVAGEQYKIYWDIDKGNGIITIRPVPVSNFNESFKSLSKKIDKQKGKSKKDADNIAGYIANIKRKGGGKGPTAKQKKRMAETILKELRK